MNNNSQHDRDLYHFAYLDVMEISRQLMFINGYFERQFTYVELLGIAFHYANLGCADEFDENPVGMPADLYEYTDKYDAKDAAFFTEKIYQIALMLRDLILKYGFYHDDMYNENGQNAPTSFLAVHSFVPYVQLIVEDLYEPPVS